MSEQPQHPGPSDEGVEHVLGNLLRTGVIVSALVVLTGGVLYLGQNGGQPRPPLRPFQGQPPQLRRLFPIFAGAVQQDSPSLIMLGLLLLIATPVARVIFSVVAFALQRDRLYIVFTLVVLAVLLFSQFIGYLTGRGAL